MAVGRCPLTADLRAAAASFLELARGGAPPATSDQLALLLGHEVVAVVGGRDLGDRRRWRVCPTEGTHAGRVCPLDLLRPFARGRVSLDTVPPRHACLASGRLLPAGLAAARAVTVTRNGSCVDHAAIRLFLDDAGRVVAVDLEVPEP